ncbi:MAG: hypothetical protein PHX34_02750 [Candidatus Shapirobacteria bacterium]|nr:hypothetical protein [Candidatus Shapirobacteria bacterium]
MSEFQPISGMERNFTVGEVEKVVEQKILNVSNKITETGLFKRENFETEQRRTDVLDEVVGLASDGVIGSYKDLIDRSCADNYDQTVINSTFDILKKGSSLAINGDQELQTSLNIGGLREIMPEGAKYDNGGHSKLDLENGILEVTITNPKIREIYREISDIRDDFDFSIPKQRVMAASEMEPYYDTLITMRNEARVNGFRDEWFAANAYINTEIGFLYGESNVKDRSIDGADGLAVLGPMVQAAEKMSKAAEKISKAFEPKKGNKRGSSTADGTVFQHEEFNFNGSEQEQMGYIEERLNVIENYNTEDIKRELALSQVTYPLFYLKDNPFANKVPDKIKEILRARLSLKAIGDAMDKNSGFVGKNGEGVIRVVEGLTKEGFDLSPEVIKMFFNNGIDGLKTAEAWNLQEMFNFGYETMLNLVWNKREKNFYGKVGELLKTYYPNGNDFFKMVSLSEALKGTKYEGLNRNYFLDKCGSIPRAEICREYMISSIWELMAKEFIRNSGDINHQLTEGELGLLRYKAEKSVQMMEFMYHATGEDSVVNWDFINGDEVAEVVNSGLCRTLDGIRGKKSKLVGPKISINGVSHLSAGFVRQFSVHEGFNGGKVHASPDQAIYMGNNIFLKELENMHIPFRGVDMKGLNSNSQIRFEKLNGKQLWAPWWSSIFMKKLWQARSDILDSETPLPRDVLKQQYLQSVIDHFNKVDGEVGNNGVVKTNWLAGKIQMLLFSPDSTWTYQDFKAFKSLILNYKYTNEDGSGDGNAFVTDKQWKWIETRLNLNKNLGRLRRHEIVMSVLKGKKR